MATREDKQPKHERSLEILFRMVVPFVLPHPEPNSPTSMEIHSRSLLLGMPAGEDKNLDYYGWKVLPLMSREETLVSPLYVSISSGNEERGNGDNEDRPQISENSCSNVRRLSRTAPQHIHVCWSSRAGNDSTADKVGTFFGARA